MLPLDFSFGENDAIIAKTVERFAASELRPHLRDFEASRAVSDMVRRRYAALGFETIDLPSAAGGTGLGMINRVWINRLLAEADAGAALALDRFAPAAYVLAEFGGIDVLGHVLEAISGAANSRLALVMDPGTGAASGELIQGEVAWAPASGADVLIGLGPGGAWVLESGFAFEPVRGAALHAAGASHIRYAGTPAHIWRNRASAARALAKLRLYYASLIWGVLADAAGFSRRYALERVAFGKPIAHHQALAFLIVDMHIAVERVGLLVEDAARAIDTGTNGDVCAALAFADAVEASRFVGPNGVQILGGHGFMRDFPVEKAMRDCRALGLLGGGIDTAREDAGRALAAAAEIRSPA